MNPQGLVFNVQRFSTDDGGGIRTCVFLKGCPLRCLWCHNAEGLSFAPELAVYPQNCIECGACTAVCPQGALSLKSGKIEITRARCLVCGRCAEACPTGTLVTVGKKMTVDEVMEIVRRDRIFYGKNGGMTITGGEPMGQAAFTIALAKAAKEEGISVAVESSGYGRTEDFEALLPFCDLFLFDCKASSEQHMALTGVKDDLILKNLDTICKGGASVVLRCPVVVGANMGDAFTEKIVSLAKKHPTIRHIQLMPYHKTGAHKSATLGKEHQSVFNTPDEQALSALAQKIENESKKETFF